MAPPQNPKFRPRTPGPRGNPYFLLIEIIIIVAIAYLVGTWVINYLAVVSVGGPTSLTLTNTTTLFSLNGGEYSGLLVSATSNAAQIAITKQPTFLNPTFYVDVYAGNTTNFNGTGRYANMQIELVSANQQSAQVTITPITPGLTIPPDTERISVAQTTLTPFGLPSTTINYNGTNTQTTTTITQGSTTTIQQSNAQAYYNNALVTLHKNPFYALMQNYSDIYASTAANCTPPIYNQSYVSKYGSSPPAADSFQNISELVPYALSMSFTNTTPYNYSAVYVTQSNYPQVSSGTVLVLNISGEANSLTSTQIEGFFQGLNYTRLLCGYNIAHNFGNSCGMYVTSSQIHASSC